MSEESISLYDLLNVSIGTPQRGAVNFSALHELLHAVLRQLGIREMKIRWTESPPRPGSCVQPEPLLEVSGTEQDTHTEEKLHRTQSDMSAVEQEVQPGTELQEGAASSSSPTPSKATKLIEELTEEMKELRHQQEEMVAQAVTAVEKCCHRVDVLEETVRSLSDTFQKYPAAEEVSRCVTWDVMRSALLSERENLHKELANSGVVDPSTAVKPSSSVSSSPRAAEDAVSPAASAVPKTSGEISTEPPQTGPTGAAMPLPREGSGSQRYPETVEALRDIGKLKQRHNKLEARVAALEEGKVDQAQLAQLRDLITNKGYQDVSDNLMDQLNQQTALIDSLMRGRDKNVMLVDDVQKSIVQLQAECEKLHETTRCLHEDNRQKQSHIEELYKTTEELEEKKADKQMVETEIKADKSALESKVSRLQFDSVTEQINSMFHELLNKVTGQEQDWHKVVDKLSTEMECKLNRIELDSVKKQLENRWKNIHEKLQAQGAPEHEDAAGIRKQLVDRFHCLSCDRPVVKHTPGPHLVTLPSTPSFPSHKSIRPFTVYALEQFRQHYRSERSDVTDYSHLVVSRSCGGSHTITSTSQRRSGLQHLKHHSQTEGEAMVQSEEVDIVGLDGHIYKGRLNAPSIRNTETKLPTICTKDGMCKTKDKAKNSPSKPAVSPEVGHGAPVHHPHSAKSVQVSRSASSSSGRDWPVSALGCTSQSSITLDQEPLGL
ncbi:hypothetical protein PAMA_009939 [Pampus argenteus]